jgi:putative aminopeptidase FrvX
VKYVERIKTHLLPLLNLQGVSGREAPVIRYMEKTLGPLVDEIKIDPMGNIFTVKHGRSKGPKVMIAAHSDEIGLMVKSILPNGFIRFNTVGGTQSNLLPARIVDVAGHTGIIGVKAGHLATEKERLETKNPRDLYIDVGASSKQEVISMGINVGSPVTFVSEPRFLKDNLIVSRALDNRAGCAVLIVLLEELKDANFKGQLHAVVTAQEEVGLRGAQVAAFKIDPNLAIALDTIPSGDTPDVDFYKELPVAIGKGPVFQVSSGADKGMFADTTVLSLLESAAKETNTNYQLASFTGGNTDATSIHLTRSGIPSAAVTIPRRYSHSPVELIDLNDAAGALQVLKTFIASMPETIQWKLPGETTR